MTTKSPSNPAQTPPDPSPDASVIRLTAAAQLGRQLCMSTAMVGACEAALKDDAAASTGRMIAAAKLMQASAQLARSLTLAALGETRHRSFVETPSPADRERERLREGKQKMIREAEAGEQAWGRLDELVEQAIRVRTGEAKGEDRIARAHTQYKQAVERLKKQAADLE